MASSTSLSSLLQRTNLDDDEEVLKACNTALKKSKGDIEAQHAKAVALLKLDRFDDALKVIEGGGRPLRDRATLEWAYALYKSGQLKEAAEVAAEIQSNRGAKHVEAQASYRAEDFLRAAEIYKELGSDKGFAHESHDLRINGGANDAQLEWRGLGESVKNKKPGREDLEAFETAYNASCGSIGRGELNQAEVLLKRAKDLCQSSTELTEQEKAAELLPMMVQHLYVLTRLGKLEEAQKLAANISVSDIPDTSTKKVAQNNILASASTQTNPYMSHRLFHEVPATAANDKLFNFQSRPLQSSSYTLDLANLKFSGVARSTLKAISKSPLPTLSPSTNSLAVLNAAAHARNSTGQAGLKHILPELEKRPNDIGLLLTVIQLYILTNNHGSAISLLESFLKRLDESISESDEDIRFSPGLVAVIVGLYKLQGRKNHIQTELAKAASYWRRKSKPPSDLLQTAGISLLESANVEHRKEAKEIFSTLHDNNPDDRLAIAGYIVSHASPASIPQMQKLDSNLTPIDRLVAGINVDALEEAGIAQSISTGTVGKRPADMHVSRPAKKTRKPRLPKDYDPSKPPDPERWLPLRERSTYRPKGKKGKQKAAQMTQGGIVAGEKGEDSGAEVSKGGPPKPASGGVVGQKKKKGKGKK